MYRSHCEWICVSSTFSLSLHYCCRGACAPIALMQPLRSALSKAIHIISQHGSLIARIVSIAVSFRLQNAPVLCTPQPLVFSEVKLDPWTEQRKYSGAQYQTFSLLACFCFAFPKYRYTFRTSKAVVEDCVSIVCLFSQRANVELFQNQITVAISLYCEQQNSILLAKFHNGLGEPIQRKIVQNNASFGENT